MYNSDTVFDTIDLISERPSKNDKLDLLKAASTQESFVRVLNFAYNPFKTYGIAKRPEIDIGANGFGVFENETWDILNMLIGRTLSGNAAIEAVRGEMTRLSMKSSELFWRIIKKDLRAGFSESSINKVVKGLIPTFPYMRCTLPKDAKLDEFDWKLGVLSQEKADGMFANIDHEQVDDESVVRITSRQGSPFPIEPFSKLVEAVKASITAGTQCHGELLVVKRGVIQPREIGNGILNSVLSGGEFEADESPLYLVWDQIPLSAVKPKGTFAMPYFERLFNLKEQLNSNANLLTVDSEQKYGSIALIETRMCHTLADAYAHYRLLLGKGREGTIIKNPHAVWKDGTSKEQVKLKLEVDVDLQVVSIVPGKEGGKNEGRAGSMTCRTSCGQLVTDVTVKNDAMRDRIDSNPTDWIDRIIVVRANSIMPPSDSNASHSLFLPRMVETDYRTDKTVPDSLQRVRDQFDSAIKAA